MRLGIEIALPIIIAPVQQRPPQIAVGAAKVAANQEPTAQQTAILIVQRHCAVRLTGQAKIIVPELILKAHLIPLVRPFLQLVKAAAQTIDKNIPFKNDKALPGVSNQKMNEYLKELGELAEIDEPVRETYYKGNERIDEVTPKYALLCTHTGRRTFICNALALGIPVQVVMKWTGHSDYKAMKPYIDVADEIKINAMNKFNLL